MSKKLYEPRPRGRPIEKPDAEIIGFYVGGDDIQWLMGLKNRSAWLSEQIKKAREKAEL